jgi:hypothetical protein
MTWSMNEAETLAKKAARGAGMSWGLTEETGKATRALLELGLDATGPLAALLTRHDGVAYAQIAPMDGWSARGGALCPIAAGVAVSDCAAGLAESPIALGRVASPMFLIPFARAAARQLNAVVCLAWDDLEIHASSTEVSFTGTLDALLCAETAAVHISAATASTTTTAGQALPHHSRATISTETAAALNAFAHRTYAPATEASRLAGAGAGLSDND